MAFQRAQKNLDGNLPIERLKSAESCNLAASNRTGFEARRRRLARSAHAIEAERGARRPRLRPPEAARDLRVHGDLRPRLVAGEVCPARSAAFMQALRLPPPHPSPSCAAGSLASARGPRTARTPHARRPLGSSGTGQRCCSRSHAVLTRDKACSHGALIHSVRTTTAHMPRGVKCIA